MEEQIQNMKNTHPEAEVIITGDFNLIMDKTYDSEENSNATVYHNQVDMLEKLMDDLQLEDTFRTMNPTDRGHTYAPTGSNKRMLYRRLDYIWVQQSIMNITINYTNTHISTSDHKLIEIEIDDNPEKEEKKPSIWRHNNLLNKDPEFLEDLHKTIEKATNDYKKETD